MFAFSRTTEGESFVWVSSVTMPRGWPEQREGQCQRNFSDGAGRLILSSKMVVFASIAIGPRAIGPGVSLGADRIAGAPRSGRWTFKAKEYEG
jgi:hypothetical protein